mmetsp:Transcript_57624/g.134182  ORF Transcript_57624/g.134182 Transcript_57624/m.134182 type:complete len:296 (-) Transcript_57624:210-1097(-)
MAGLHFLCRFFLQASLLARALATQLYSNSRDSLRGQLSDGVVSSEDPLLEPMQNLMICNAYASAEGIDVLALRSGKRLSAAGPLAYKDCADHRLPLHEGDQLEFRVGNLSVGIFRARGLPPTEASLLLVPHRRHPSSNSAAFQSTAFADLGSSQLVVIDVYRGKGTGKLKLGKLVDNAKSESTQEAQSSPSVQSEPLKFNSIVPVRPGNYQLMLENPSNKSMKDVTLHVSDARAKFVLMRTGNEVDAAEADPKAAFPQELVLHWQNEGSQRSSAAACSVFLVATAVALRVLSAEC